MNPITLSNRQVKEADRVAGIELMILWPPALGAEPQLDPDCERDAVSAERAAAERLVGGECDRLGLVILRVRVACVRRPSGQWARSGEYAVHLAVHITGRRWVHATHRPAPKVMYVR
jgi:hypothetical protein